MRQCRGESVGRRLSRVIGTALAVLGMQAGSAFAQAYTVAKPQCRADDRIETGLQGQVPQADRASGAAAPGYWCNLTEIGATGSTAGDPSHAKLSGWANFDTYGHCAYFHDGNDGSDAGGGTIVMDLSDPAHPKQTAYLTTPAMRGPWESLRANVRRGLLVAGHQSSAEPLSGDTRGTSPLDVYDVSQDCAHPKLLFSGALPNAVGHEGWFQPDGMVYYVSGTSAVGGQVVPVDLSDPRHPKELAVWEIAAHGGSVSDDGRRGYFCLTAGELLIADTSQAAERRVGAQYEEISRVSLPLAYGCQETYPVTYGDRPYVIQFGELADTNLTCPSSPAGNFSRPNIIDIVDEKDPKLVATLMNEVAVAENCPLVVGDRSVTNNPNGAGPTAVFVYGTHFCHPDRLHDPTILACSEFMSGVRVYDIRDPLKAKEIAYFNAGSLAVGDPTVDMAASRPVIRPDLGQIWYDGAWEGFHTLKFADGLYPFPESNRCPTRPDWFVEQYNVGLRCPQAARAPVASPGCRTRLRVTVRGILGARRAQGLRSATVYVGSKRVRTVRRARSLRKAVVLSRLRGGTVIVRVVGRRADGRRVTGRRTYDLCAASPKRI